MTGWTSRAPLLLALLPCSLGAEAPEGFRPIFNGQNLAGWHMSLTNHHGDSKEWRVFEGALVGMQDREGNGGILLTDEKFGDFEVYLEIKPDFGCDGGLFLRSTGSGANPSAMDTSVCWSRSPPAPWVSTKPSTLRAPTACTATCTATCTGAGDPAGPLRPARRGRRPQRGRGRPPRPPAARSRHPAWSARSRARNPKAG